jgi:hypothetical protein
MHGLRPFEIAKREIDFLRIPRQQSQLNGIVDVSNLSDDPETLPMPIVALAFRRLPSKCSRG